MQKIKAGLMISALVAAAACSPEPTEPHWENVCVEFETVIVQMPTRIGELTVMRPQPITRCASREMHCIIPEGREGEQCPPMPVQD